MRSFQTEYYMLAHVRPHGPVLGYVAGKAVRASVSDQWDRTYRYAGLVPHRADGSLNLELLKCGEWIVEPGLIYSLEDGSFLSGSPEACPAVRRRQSLAKTRSKHRGTRRTFRVGVENGQC